MVNSRLSLFTAARKGYGRLAASPHGHPFSRSYRANLSSSLTRVLPFTLGHLPLPTCVGLRYGRRCSWQRRFSWRHRINGIPPGSIPGVFALLSSGNGFAYPPHRLQGQTRHVRWARPAYLPASLLCFKAEQRRCRNFDLLSIAFAVRYGLGPTYPTPINVA